MPVVVVRSLQVTAEKTTHSTDRLITETVITI